MDEEKASFDDTSAELLEIVLTLPEKYRNVIYLYYYEEYSATEIAGILGKKKIPYIHGFPGQEIYCVTDWEVIGHECVSEKYERNTGNG